MSELTEYVFRDDPHELAELQLGVDAQTAGEELDRIRRRDGTIAPKVVVDEARPEEAPLHPAFEWRDPVAAEQWREHQAKTLIRRVRVAPAPQPEAPVSRVKLERPALPLQPLVEEFDPLRYDLDLAVGSLTETRRQIEALREKAVRRFDRKKVIAADVALHDLKEAETLLTDANEALTASREASKWPAMAG